MIFKDKEAEVLWEQGLKNNDDPYGSCIYKYAKEWAEEMEVKIADGCRLEDVAKKTSFEVDKRPGFGITGFMYGAAVSTLSHVWLHGEQLRRWHNHETQIGNEGDKANQVGGVLNPAIINIK